MLATLEHTDEHAKECPRTWSVLLMLLSEALLLLLLLLLPLLLISKLLCTIGVLLTPGAASNFFSTRVRPVCTTGLPLSKNPDCLQDCAQNDLHQKDLEDFLASHLLCIAELYNGVITAISTRSVC
jgi:hypothetical protein